MIWAALASILAHAVLILVADVELPGHEPEPPPIVAVIKAPEAEPQRPPAEKVQRPKPRPKARVAPAVVPAVAPQPAPAVAGEEAPAAEAVAKPPAPEPEAADAAVPPPPVLPATLGAGGSIRFTVFRGDQGFEIGQAVHRWEAAEGRYALRAVTETTGLAAVFVSARVEQESSGELTPAGLRPLRFVTRRSGRSTRGESARFDWAAGRIEEEGGVVEPLPAGAQDVLSFMYQLAILSAAGLPESLPVTSGRRLDARRIEVLGEEEVKLAQGAVRALRVRVPERDQSTEFWLAPEWRGLPVRMRHIDRKGEIYEHLASEIKLEGQ